MRFHLLILSLFLSVLGFASDSLNTTMVYHPYYNGVQLITVTTLPTIGPSLFFERGRLPDTSSYMPPALILRALSGKILMQYNATKLYHDSDFLPPAQARKLEVPHRKKWCLDVRKQIYPCPDLFFAGSFYYEINGNSPKAYPYTHEMTIYSESEDYFNHGYNFRSHNPLQYGLLDTLGRVVVEPIYDHIEVTGKGYILSKQGKAALVDRNLKELIPYQYPYMASAGHGLLMVIDSLGLHTDRVSVDIFPPQNQEITREVIYAGGPARLIDRKGNACVSGTYDHIYPFVHGYAIVERKQLYGFVDSLGREVIAPQYTYVHQFNGAPLLANVYKEHRRFYVNGQGLRVPDTTQYTVQSDYKANRFLVSKDHKYGFADGYGKLVIPYMYDYTHEFIYGRLTKVGIKKNVNGKTVIKYGCIDVNNKILVPLIYDTLHIIAGWAVEVTKDGKTERLEF